VCPFLPAGLSRWSVVGPGRAVATYRSLRLPATAAVCVQPADESSSAVPLMLPSPTKRSVRVDSICAGGAEVVRVAKRSHCSGEHSNSPCIDEVAETKVHPDALRPTAKLSSTLPVKPHVPGLQVHVVRQLPEGSRSASVHLTTTNNIARLRISLSYTVYRRQLLSV